ncbi:hypothetical protein D3C81_2013180 [compost metagenome]
MVKRDAAVIVFENLRSGSTFLSHAIGPPLTHANTMSVAIGCDQNFAALSA